MLLSREPKTREHAVATSSRQTIHPGRDQVSHGHRLEMLLAKKNQFSIARKTVDQKPEAFEDGTIAETHCVINNLFIIAVVTLQIGCKAISCMLDAATDCWIIKHVDYRTMHTGDGHLCMMVPNILRAKNLCSLICFIEITCRF